MWVADGGSNSVTKLSPNGAVLGTFTAGNFPGDIAIDASGNVLVTNNVGSSNNVTKLSPGGAVLGTFTVGNSISDIAIDAPGNVWVNSYLINSVTVLRGATTGPQFWPYSGPVWP